ncbi:thioredoxin domain-containing protein [Nibrella saemangeumensis]|uniref:Thioredoxin domain-containing protein n=2 Tax=Nibrella saemangeumensis TaxID=1084526 RepID=A0ABP8N019_9BACT
MLAGSLLSWAVFAQQPVLVSPQTADSLLRNVPAIQLLDVRTAGEFASGHLRNARNLDVRDPEFEKKLAQLDPKRPLVVYCLVGGRSAKAAETLAKAGFTLVYDMQGGFAKWSGSGMPIEEGATPPKGGMTLDEFTRLTAAGKPVLVDFYAKWCAPCQKMLPTVKKLEKEMASQVRIITLDYDQNRQLAQQLGIDSIPAFLMYKDGKVHWKTMGMVEEKEFRTQIKAVQ